MNNKKGQFFNVTKNGMILPVVFIALVSFGLVSLSMVNRFEKSGTKQYVAAAIQMGKRAPLEAALARAKFEVLNPEGAPRIWSLGTSDSYDLQIGNDNIHLTIDDIEVPTKFKTNVFTGAYYDNYGLSFNCFRLTIGDYDGDGVVSDYVDSGFLDGSKKVFYLDHRPVHRFGYVTKNGVLLSTASYSYHIRNGWISFNEVYSTTNTVEVVYDYSHDLDIYAHNGGDGQDRLYRNDDGFVFTPFDISLDTVPHWTSEGAFGDYDGNGAIDFLVSNSSNTVLWINDGSGNFTAKIDITAIGDEGGTPLWGDFDNDGDLDIFLGRVVPDTCKLFRNDGAGVFTEIWSYAPAGSPFSPDIGDYDGDGDLDLLIGLSIAPNVWEVIVLENIYSTNPGAVFSGPKWNFVGDVGKLRWVDVDNDGDLDFGFTAGGWANQARIYRNDGLTLGSPVFTQIWEDTRYTFPGLDFWDVDQDGDQDMVATFQKIGTDKYPKVRYYANDGAGDFTYEWGSDEDPNSAIYDAISYSQHAELADFDNDGKIDVAVSGRHIGGMKPVIVFRNTYMPLVVRYCRVRSLYEKGNFKTWIDAFFKLNIDGEVTELHSMENN